MPGATSGIIARRACVTAALALSFCSASAHAVTVDGDLSDLIAQINSLGSTGTVYNWAQGSDPLGVNDTPPTESGNGSDIKDMFGYYHSASDTLYLGMTVWGNVGTSGDLEGILGGQAGVFDSNETYGFDVRYPGTTQVVRFDVLGEDVDGFGGDPAFGFFSTNPYTLTVDWAVSVANNGVEFSVSGLAGSGALGSVPPDWPVDIILSFYAGSATNAGAEDMAQLNMQLVPIPAAVWLLLSGLLGLGAVARRRG